MHGKMVTKRLFFLDLKPATSVISFFWWFIRELLKFSIYLSIYLSISLFIFTYLTIYLSKSLHICLSIYVDQNTHGVRSNQTEITISFKVKQQCDCSLLKWVTIYKQQPITWVADNAWPINFVVSEFVSHIN